jgi:hypothetical protein
MLFEERIVLLLQFQEDADFSLTGKRAWRRCHSALAWKIFSISAWLRQTGLLMGSGYHLVQDFEHRAERVQD